MSAQPESISEHYDRRSPVVESMNGEGQVHMWYWSGEEDRSSLAEAVEQMTDKALAPLNPQPGEHVLDAGCGTGSTAVRLAGAHGCRVTGVTLSPVEVQRARRLADRSGVAHTVDVRLGDYHHLDHDDETFDAVLAQESLQNAEDLDAALRELFRVTRPGGRLTVADLTLAGEHDDRLQRFMDCLRLPRLITAVQWAEAIGRAGFSVEEITLCGPRTIGRRNRFLTEAMALRPSLVAEHGEAATAEHGSLHRDFFRPRPHQVGYVVVTARRPRPTKD